MLSSWSLHFISIWYTCISIWAPVVESDSVHSLKDPESLISNIKDTLLGFLVNKLYVYWFSPMHVCIHEVNQMCWIHFLPHKTFPKTIFWIFKIVFTWAVCYKGCKCRHIAPLLYTLPCKTGSRNVYNMHAYPCVCIHLQNVSKDTWKCFHHLMFMIE